jgi:formylglycine-generating enzyme required for sulfatase activity
VAGGALIRGVTRMADPAADPAEERAARDPRVVRGGSFLGNERNARCAFRCWVNPVNWYYLIGFRVVVSLSSP